MRPQHHLIPDRQALRREQLLGELLVHARGAGEHPGADVGHACELEQPLNGAVLAVRAVQDGEDDVDGGQQLTGTLVERYQLSAAPRIGGQGQRGARRVAHVGQLAVGDGEGLGSPVGEHPGALG